jgi:DNA modification methylase
MGKRLANNSAQHQWPADKVERRPLGSLVPYPENARTHSQAQIEQIAASMREWGWTNPVLVDEAGTIIAGHGRVLAASQLGYGEIPVIVARGWSDAQKRAYILADNQLALNAGWDIGLLKGELRGLKDWGFDLDLLGFDNLEALLADDGTQGLTDPDAAPALPEVPTARVGDVWLLGRHRLVCGDATKAQDAACALNGVEPHLMVTDPPYGVNYDPAWREGADLEIGKRSKGKVQNDDRADWREAWALFPGSTAYVWHSGLHTALVQETLIAAGFSTRAQIIWVKQHFVLSRGDYHWQHEPCWYAVRGKGSYAGDRKQTTVWEIKNNNSFGNANHERTWGLGTQKPVECMKRPIENNSSIGQAVYDPFIGSGTTIIAAEMTGRACHAMEIDPRYCDVSIERWQSFTGKEAKLDGGSTFAKVLKKRKS